MPPKKARPQKKACDVCYRRKIQCSLPTPEGPCEWCDHRNLECTFDRERPRKRRRNNVKSSDIHELFQRIEQVEKALAKTGTTEERDASSYMEPEILASSASSSPQTSRRPDGRELIVSVEQLPSPAGAQAPDTSLGHDVSDEYSDYITFAHQLGPNWYFNGITISSEAGHQWISTRTDQPAMWVDFNIPIKTSSPLAIYESNLSQETYKLPDKDATRNILNQFFKSSFRQTFPVLDEELFELTIATAYESTAKGTPSPDQIAARSCVLSALSIASHFDLPRKMPVSIDVDICAEKARNLLMHTNGNTSLASLQAAIMLELRHVFRTHWQEAAILHSAACHIVCSLQRHISQPFQPGGVESPHSEREKRHIRILFWLCYMLDKDISLRTGNPPRLIDEYCDLTPLEDHLEYYTYLSGLDQPFKDDDQASVHLSYHSPGDIYIYRLKEKVYRLLFSARALNDNDNQLILNIRQLDDEIEHWRLSIPIKFRPALFVSQNLSSNMCNESIPHAVRRISLQLEYHHLMTVVHTTVRKCTAEASDGTRDLHDVVHSSFDISLVASRSSLQCLKFLINTIAERAFRPITFYAIPAAMSLFLNVVIHPSDPQVQLDLELLISTANSIRSMPTEAMTQGEAELIHQLSDFVMRLVWLGSCAVMKVKRGKKKTL